MVTKKEIIRRIKKRGAGKYYIKIDRTLYDVDYKPGKYMSYKKLKKLD